MSREALGWGAVAFFGLMALDGLRDKTRARAAARRAQRAAEKVEQKARKKELLAARGADREALRARLGEYEATIAGLRRTTAEYLEQIRALHEQRDELAERVEQQASTIVGLQNELEGARANVGTRNPDAGQFHRLRALIAKELHPDHAPVGSLDR